MAARPRMITLALGLVAILGTGCATGSWSPYHSVGHLHDSLKLVRIHPKTEVLVCNFSKPHPHHRACKVVKRSSSRRSP